ncbi:MAG TPA: FG-GAP repeat protein, partial [Planctomycetota bacterium]|nr:FG-GAP repeat protein [Planctomycetota bacterium]
MICRTSHLLAAVLAATTGLCASAAAQCEGLKLTPPVPQPHAYLSSVALGPHVLVSGAPGFRKLSGAAFVFDPATGELLHTLTASDPQPLAYFGNAVALHGGAAVVGAYRTDDVGSAYLFDLTSGLELHRLLPAVPKTNSAFGSDVAIDADFVAVGSPGNFPSAPDEGMVHVYDRASGASLHAISSPEPSGVFENTHYFGRALDLDGGLLLVGANGPENVGAAYVFDAATGALLHELLPPPGSDPKNFGFALDLHGRLAVVGDSGAFPPRGGAHVYDAITGQLLYSVPGPDSVGGTGFGYSVAIDGRALAVGAKYQQQGGGHQGRVYVYSSATGAPAFELDGHPSDPTSQFG